MQAIAQRSTLSILARDKKGTVRTTMSKALLQALDDDIAKGRNSGRIGRMVIKANAKGIGVKFVPREKTAETAGSINGHRRAASKAADQAQFLVQKAA